MRIRGDFTFVASVLFTVALLSLVPWFWRDALAGREVRSLQSLDVSLQAAERYTAYFGLASLVIILIGLTVTWLGYINKAGWTWFVQFIIAWLWVFPLLVWPLEPLLTHRSSWSLTELLYSAIHQKGWARRSVESFLIFFLMVLALLLPIKSFFRTQQTVEPVHKRSRIVTIASVTTALVALTALYLWINFRQYELSPQELGYGQDMPPVPSPLPPSRAEKH